MAETYLLNKLKSVEQTFNELNRRLADPDIATDPAEFQRVASLALHWKKWLILMKLGNHPEEELAGLVRLKEAASDPELQEMAALEVEELAAN